MSEADRIAHVVVVLPKSSACRVAHLLADPPEDSFLALKGALLSSHQLTDIQQAECLFNMDNLGSGPPMDLFSEML